MEAIGLPQVGLGSGWALVAVFVVLIYRGALIPRRTYDDKVHDASEWRTESRLKDAQLAEKDKQLEELSEVARAVKAVMRAIQRGPVPPDRKEPE
jgi:hypothetical protein